MKLKFFVLVAVVGISGCGTNFKEIGREPAMSPVGSGIGASGPYSYPEPPASRPRKFSLWDDRQSRLFTDPRALRAGDIMTVKITMHDTATF
ncbi:flagellar basal body L-ring protein, partial [Mesorhizobium sp. M00.F.Ca.ET.149.01.1.1]